MITQFFILRLPIKGPVKDSDRFLQTEEQARLSQAIARLQYLQRYGEKSNELDT